MIRVSARFVTEVNSFTEVDEVVKWIEDGSEARAVIGEKLCTLHSRNGGIVAQPIGGPDDEADISILTEGDIGDLLDNGDIIGVSYDGDTDGDYTKFGIRM